MSAARLGLQQLCAGTSSAPHCKQPTFHHTHALALSFACGGRCLFAVQETLLLSEDELRQIWYMMEELGSYNDSGDEVRINYDGFSQVGVLNARVWAWKVGLCGLDRWVAWVGSRPCGGSKSWGCGSSSTVQPGFGQVHVPEG